MATLRQNGHKIVTVRDTRHQNTKHKHKIEAGYTYNSVEHKSEIRNIYRAMDLLSNRIKAEPIEDEDQANLRMESVDQEDELAVVMKCETLPEKPEVKCDEFGSMGVSGFDAESNIKIEYDPDSKFDAPIDEIKAEEIAENWNDAYLNLDESRQIKVEDFPVLDEKLEGKLCSELNEEFDMKPENDSSTQSDSVFNMNKKLQAVNVGAERKLLICDDCNQRFSSKVSLINHTCAGKISYCNVGFTRKETFHDKHKEFIASVSSKILKCIHCNYKTTSKYKLAKHMRKHFPFTFSVCEYCNESYRRKEDLDKHISRNHPDGKTLIKRKMHKCSQCDYKTTKRYTLTEHMLTHPGTKSELATCQYCNESLKGKTSLDNHIIKKHPDLITAIKRKIHECGECNYKTTRKNAIERHALTHSSAVREMYACEHCDATFKSEETLDNHIFKNHPEFIASIKGKILECMQCGYKTTIRNTLTKHIWRHSNKMTKLSVCQDCNASFKQERSLHDHILKNHPDLSLSIVRKMHECTQCDYKTIMKQNLTKHMSKHHGIAFAPSVCQHCKAAFKSKGTLDSHILRNHPDSVESIRGKIYECTQCDYKTVMKHHLTKHMSKHDRIVLAPSVCQHCNEAFKSKGTLDSHILRNHPDFVESIRGKIYECTQCDYRTLRKSSLDGHIITHPGMATELIICEHCKMKFKSAVCLDNHILKKHPNFESSVEGKIHQCELCPYRSTLKNIMSRHIRLTHSSTASELFT